jgi:hypothetical protein
MMSSEVSCARTEDSAIEDGNQPKRRRKSGWDVPTPMAKVVPETGPTSIDSNSVLVPQLLMPQQNQGELQRQLIAQQALQALNPMLLRPPGITAPVSSISHRIYVGYAHNTERVLTNDYLQYSN